MNTQNTKPWEVYYMGCNDWDLIGPTTNQDWKLAAAAPELLELVELLLICHDDPKSISYEQQKDKIHAQAKDVIAKLKGYQQ